MFWQQHFRKLTEMMYCSWKNLEHVSLVFKNNCICVDGISHTTIFLFVHCPAPGMEFGEEYVAVPLSLLWCQRHVKTTLSSCDHRGFRSSAIPDSNWWPPAVPTVAMPLFCFMFRLQEAVYCPGHIGCGASWMNRLSFSFKTWWWITGS